MEEFTLGLALYDFVPVVLTGIAVFFIARLTQAGNVPYATLAFLGAGLVFAAGLLKAIWKLNATLTGVDVVWMANALFPLMAPGFALLAAGMWGSQRGLRGRDVPVWFWLAPLALIGLTYSIAAYQTWGAGIERGWFTPIMNLASAANITLTAVLFLLAWRQGQRGLASLLLVNLAMVFALIPIAQMESHSIAMHWFEQTLTAIGAGTFAYANYRLYQTITTDATVDGARTGSKASLVTGASAASASPQH
jgi:hypothetical protein